MITGEISFQIWAQYNNTFRMIKKNYVKNGWLKSRNLSEEKKTHPEHNYSVTFVSKVGTKTELCWINFDCLRQFPKHFFSGAFKVCYFSMVEIDYKLSLFPTNHSINCPIFCRYSNSLLIAFSHFTTSAFPLVCLIIGIKQIKRIVCLVIQIRQIKRIVCSAAL